MKGIAVMLAGALVLSVGQVAAAETLPEEHFAEAFLAMEELRAKPHSDEAALVLVSVAKAAIEEMQESARTHPLTLELFGNGVATWGGGTFAARTIFAEHARLDLAVRTARCRSTPDYACAMDLALDLTGPALRTRVMQSLCEAAALDGDIAAAEDYAQSEEVRSARRCVSAYVGALAGKGEYEEAATLLASARPGQVGDTTILSVVDGLLAEGDPARARRASRLISDRAEVARQATRIAAHVWEASGPDAAIDSLLDARPLSSAENLLPLAGHFMAAEQTAAAMRVLHEMRRHLIAALHAQGAPHVIAGYFLDIARLEAAAGLQGAALADLSTALQVISDFEDMDMRDAALANAAAANIEIRGDAGRSRAELLLLTMSDADGYQALSDVEKSMLHANLDRLGDAYRGAGQHAIGLDALSQVYMQLGMDPGAQCPIAVLRATKDSPGAAGGGAGEAAGRCGVDVVAALIADGRGDEAVALIGSLGRQAVNAYYESAAAAGAEASGDPGATPPLAAFADAVDVGAATLGFLEDLYADAMAAGDTDTALKIVEKIRTGLGVLPENARAGLLLSLRERYAALDRPEEAAAALAEAEVLIAEEPRLSDLEALVAALADAGRGGAAIELAFGYEEEGWTGPLVAHFAAAEARRSGAAE